MPTEKWIYNQLLGVYKFSYTWHIPQTFTTSSELNFKQTDRNIYWLWRSENSKFITLDSLSANDWFICKTYRVNYQNSDWLALAQQLKDNHLCCQRCHSGSSLHF